MSARKKHAHGVPMKPSLMHARAAILGSALRHRLATGTAGSAVLLTLAHVPFSLAPLGLVALVPWALATRGRGIVCGAWTGSAIGLLFGLAVSRWIPEALAVRGAGLVPSILGWLLTSLWAGALPLALLCGGIRALDRVGPALQIPGAATLAEDLPQHASWPDRDVVAFTLATAIGSRR